MSAARRVGLLFGGRSVEHEVSVISARAVAAAIEQASMECVPIGVTGCGRWLPPEWSRAILDGDATRAEVAADADDSRLLIDAGGRRLVRLTTGREPRTIEVDVVFPLVHGWGGEDGRLQGALDLADIPYVGPGVTGSAVGMDKIASKRIFESHGLPGVRWLALDRGELAADPEAVRRRVVSELGLPVFVKPVNGGSSVGVSKVADESALVAACDAGLAYDHRVVVEAGISAREVECAVLGNDRPEASVLGEITPSREFYDYAAKYLDGSSTLAIPALLDPATTATIRGYAVAAFRALGLAGLARVDFLVDRDSGEIYLNEANSLPGFTPISMFPKLWEASGLPFPRLVERLILLAMERREADRGLRTRWGDGGPATVR